MTHQLESSSSDTQLVPAATLVRPLPPFQWLIQNQRILEQLFRLLPCLISTSTADDGTLDKKKNLTDSIRNWYTPNNWERGITTLAAVRHRFSLIDVERNQLREDDNWSKAHLNDPARDGHHFFSPSWYQGGRDYGYSLFSETEMKTLLAFTNHYHLPYESARTPDKNNNTLPLSSSLPTIPVALFMALLRKIVVHQPKVVRFSSSQSNIIQPNCGDDPDPLATDTTTATIGAPPTPVATVASEIQKFRIRYPTMSLQTAVREGHLSVLAGLHCGYVPTQQLSRQATSPGLEQIITEPQNLMEILVCSEQVDLVHNLILVSRQRNVVDKCNRCSSPSNFSSSTRIDRRKNDDPIVLLSPPPPQILILIPAYCKSHSPLTWERLRLFWKKGLLGVLNQPVQADLTPSSSSSK